MAARPDVLVVLTDQQRPDTIGAYGQGLPTTPILDSLAADGVTFDAAFTVQPVCGPARAAIQTGMMPTDIGCWRNGLALPQGIPTLASRLTDIGYRTGYVGKWHLASDRGPNLATGRAKAQFARRAVPPERRGGYGDLWAGADALELTSGAHRGHLFDEEGRKVALSGYRVDAVTEVAADRLERLCRDDKPFLLFVSHLEPHHQNNRFRTIAPRGTARRFADYEVPGDLRGTLGDWRWNFAATLGCAEAIDTGLGKLVDVLRAHGRFDNTLTIFSSDHGSHFRTRNLEYKRSPHDASIRVPMVIRGPGFRGGGRCDRLVTHLDILPTVMTSTGNPVGDVRGKPLQDALGAGPWPDEVVVQISESQIGRGLRTPTHTFAAAAPGWNPLRAHMQASSDEYRATHLYDLTVDPFQRVNLVSDADHTDTRDRLAGRLADAIETLEGSRPRIMVGR